MADNSVYVTFGADSSALDANIALVKAAISAMVKEMASLSSEQRKAGEAAESELGQKMVALSAKLGDARAKLREFQNDLREVGAVAEQTGAGEGGKGVLGLNPVQVAESIHIVKSLFDEIAAGQSPMRALALEGGRIGQVLSAGIPAAVLQWAGLGAAVLAVGGVFFAVAARIGETNAALQNIRLDTAVAGFQTSTEAAAKLLASIRDLGQVSSTEAEQIYKPFSELGAAGATISQLLAPVLKSLAQQMGTDLAGAAKRTAESFIDLTGAGVRAVNQSQALTQAQKDNFAQLVANGAQNRAYAVLVDVISRSVETLQTKQKTAAAAAIDHATALQDAALAGGDMRAAQEHAGEAVAAATAKDQAQIAALEKLRGELLSASSAAGTFGAAMSAAIKLDTVGTSLKETEAQIAKLQAGLAAALDRASESTDRMVRALTIANEKLKALNQQQGDPAGLNRDLLQQDTDALKHYDDTFRGSEQARLTGHIAMLRGMLESDQINTQQRFKLQQDLEASEKQLYDSQTKTSTKASTDELGAAQRSIQGQIQALEDQTRTTIEHLNAQVKLKQLTEQQKSAAAIKAYGDEAKAADALFAKELALAGLTKTRTQDIENQKQRFDDSNALQIQEAMEKSAQASQKAWDNAFKGIGSAFDSEIGPLLRGTEGWGDAVRNVLASLTEDLLKFFINWGLQQAERYAQDIALNAAGVAAHQAP